MAAVFCIRYLDVEGHGLPELALKAVAVDVLSNWDLRFFTLQVFSFCFTRLIAILAS